MVDKSSPQTCISILVTKIQFDLTVCSNEVMHVEDKISTNTLMKDTLRVILYSFRMSLVYPAAELFINSMQLLLNRSNADRKFAL